MATVSHKAAPAGERDTIRKIVATHKPPPGVKTFQVELGEDSTGEPAVWVWFVVDDDRNPTAKQVAKLTHFASAVSASIIASDIGRWPYVSFRARK
jgi:hypothetical protein